MSSGKPSGGKPTSPRNSATTDSGKAISRAGSITSAADRSLATIISAMSPTTLEVGVTLVTSPNSLLTSE